ncbi:MAG: helix-turn-helix domain-containing protein [Candidatus Eremiobacteraeota bacterium]|nr:helix-turn-helix domain-containing protein [Candidatus Eremiobacteraeota bacterium]
MEHIAVALDEAIASDAGRFGLSTIVADDVAVALLPARERGAPLAWRTRTDRLLRGVFAVSASLELTAGVGRWYAERDGLRRSFAEARLAATIGSHVGGARSVTLYEQLGVYRLLASVVDRGTLAEFRAEHLGPIADDADLLATLRAYLNARGNKALCAKALYVHLNTVKYRLRRIADLTGRDLDDAQELLNLHVALEIGDVLPLLGTIPSP